MQNEFFLHTALALWSVAVGAFICAVYDLFRIFRLRRRQNAIVLFLCDLLFCAIATVCMLVLFFNLSYGRVRAYAFVFAFFGFLAWRFTVSRAVISLCLRLVSCAERLLHLIKMRLMSLFMRLSRKIYTAFYCKITVKKARRGFGLKK